MCSNVLWLIKLNYLIKKKKEIKDLLFQHCKLLTERKGVLITQNLTLYENKKTINDNKSFQDQIV